MSWIAKVRTGLRDCILWWLSMPRQWLREWLGIAAHEEDIRLGFADLRARMQYAEQDNERQARDLNEIDSRLAERIDKVETGQGALAKGLEQINAALTTGDERLRGELEGIADNLQAQIVELGKLPLDAAPKPKEVDGKTQIDPGFRRFTSRKKDWERAHAQPKTTETGKQIEENHRLIASGTRKTE